MMRLHELAKELKLSSADMQEKLAGAGFVYKNRLNALSPEAIDKMRTLYGPLPERPVRKPEPPKKKEPPRQTQRPGAPPQRPGAPPQRPGAPPQRPGAPPQRPGAYPQRPGAPQRPGTQQQRPGAPPQKPGAPAQPPAPAPTVRKLADLPASVTKSADGRITMPSSVARSVKKKMSLPANQRIETAPMPKTLGEIGAPPVKKEPGKPAPPKPQKPGVDYSQFEAEDTVEKPKTPAVSPLDREVHRRTEFDYFGGKEIRVIVPARRGRDRGKQQGVIVRKKTGGKETLREGVPLTAGVQKKEAPAPLAPVEFKRPEKLAVSTPITIRDLSSKLGIKATDIIRKLMMEQKVMTTINDYLGDDAVIALGLEFGTEIEIKQMESSAAEELQLLISAPDNPEDLVPRSPVVAFLGHVDHGKTSLLDAIRKTKVQASEAGGITQNFTAWAVKRGESRIVFLDTPGHEAFTAMRSRGANVTDIVVLVVAADDGVMPQTEEALNHAKAAGVAIVIALNKVDKPNANIMRTKQQLAGLGLNPPEWGGKTEMVETSATQKMGIDELLETLVLEAEMLELKTNPKKPAMGVVLESEISEGRGVVARLLVKDGSLKRGDVIFAGTGYGRVRDIIDSDGNSVESVGAPAPVEVSGLDEIPAAGDKFYVIGDQGKARELAEMEKKRQRDASLANKHHVTLENILATIEASAAKEVRLIVKADVMGSVEVLDKAVTELSKQEVKVKVIHSAVGGINESDILLADASDAIVFGFNVVPDDKARALAEEKGVDVRIYQVIYQLIDDLKLAMEGLLDPEVKEEIHAHAEIRNTFRASKIGVIAGCAVKSGTMLRTDKVRLIRDGKIIYTGEMESLRRFKDDVREVKEGFECGLKIKGYDDVKVGDTVESFAISKVARTFSESK